GEKPEPRREAPPGDRHGDPGRANRAAARRTARRPRRIRNSGGATRTARARRPPDHPHRRAQNLARAGIPEAPHRHARRPRHRRRPLRGGAASSRGAPQLLADRDAGRRSRVMRATGNILDVNDLNAAYGESKVLFDIAISVKPNEVVACVGRNGAGKTTLLKSIVGFLKPVSGTVVAGGENLVGLTPYVVAGKGIKYIPQDKKVFSDLTVRENLELGSYASKDYGWDKVYDYFPKLKILLDRKAGYLSGGERQMLMVGRAILGHPKLLLVDEPTEGLAPSIVSHLKDVFRDLAKTTALIIVEQNLPMICAIADKIYALSEGRVMAELTERDQIKPEVCEKYL